MYFSNNLFKFYNRRFFSQQYNIYDDLMSRAQLKLNNHNFLFINNLNFSFLKKIKVDNIDLVFPQLEIQVFSELLKVNECHWGVPPYKWNPYNANFFVFFSDVWGSELNVNKVLVSTRNSLLFVSNCSNFRNSILYLVNNFHSSFKLPYKTDLFLNNPFSKLRYINSWSAGFLKNRYYVLFVRKKFLFNINKKKLTTLHLRNKILDRISNLITTFIAPACIIFLSSTFKNRWGILESKNSFIPTVALVSGDSLGLYVTYAIYGCENRSVARAYYFLLIKQSFVKGNLNRVLNELNSLDYLTKQNNKMTTKQFLFLNVSNLFLKVFDKIWFLFTSVYNFYNYKFLKYKNYKNNFFINLKNKTSNFKFKIYNNLTGNIFFINFFYRLSIFYYIFIKKPLNISYIFLLNNFSFFKLNFSYVILSVVKKYLTLISFNNLLQLFINIVVVNKSNTRNIGHVFTILINNIYYKFKNLNYFSNYIIKNFCNFFFFRHINNTNSIIFDNLNKKIKCVYSITFFNKIKQILKNKLINKRFRKKNKFINDFLNLFFLLNHFDVFKLNFKFKNHKRLLKIFKKNFLFIKIIHKFFFFHKKNYYLLINNNFKNVWYYLHNSFLLRLDTTKLGLLTLNYSPFLHFLYLNLMKKHNLNLFINNFQLKFINNMFLNFNINNSNDFIFLNFIYLIFRFNILKLFKFSVRTYRKLNKLNKLNNLIFIKNLINKSNVFQLIVFNNFLFLPFIINSFIKQFYYKSSNILVLLQHTFQYFTYQKSFFFIAHLSLIRNKLNSIVISLFNFFNYFFKYELINKQINFKISYNLLYLFIIFINKIMGFFLKNYKHIVFINITIFNLLNYLKFFFKNKILKKKKLFFSLKIHIAHFFFFQKKLFVHFVSNFFFFSLIKLLLKLFKNNNFTLINENFKKIFILFDKNLKKNYVHFKLTNFVIIKH